MAQMQQSSRQLSVGACLIFHAQTKTLEMGTLNVMVMLMGLMQQNLRNVLEQFRYLHTVIACPVLMEFINTIVHTKFFTAIQSRLPFLLGWLKSGVVIPKG